MSNKKTTVRTFDLQFWIIFILFLIAIAYSFSLPSRLADRDLWGLSESSTSDTADTVGGLLGPIIAIAAGILTFFAFWVQFKANEQQKLDLKIERFENKYYELVRLHRANVEEMKVGKTLTSRKCFVHMFYELRYIYKITESHYETACKSEPNLYEEKVDVLELAYTIFFFGIGLNSEKHYIKLLNKEEKILFDRIKELLGKMQDKYTDFMEKNPSATYYTHGLPASRKPDDNTIDFFYYPFDGHINKLGHYYRHLFQTATFITEQNFLEDDDRYPYFKTLRAQLSDFEQLMLYYNSLVWFGSEWKPIFVTHRLIKNLPLQLADFYISPETLFEKEIKEADAKGKPMFAGKRTSYAPV